MRINLKDLDEKYNKQEEIKKRQLQLAEEDFKASLSEKDTSQQEVLYTDKPKYLLTGTAGSGKTIVAMMKALELEVNNCNYIIIIYTKALKYYLLGKMKNGKFKDVENKVFYGEELIKNKEYASELKDRKVDYVIIDEVQDFPIECIEEYLSMARKGYFLYGDNGQQIYPERTNNKNIIQEIKDNFMPAEFNLKRTYRVPINIAKFAEKIDRRNTCISNDCYNIGGDKPIVKEFSDFESEMKYILNKVKEESWKKVGILVRTNDDVTEVANYLNGIGLICEQKDKTIDNIDFSTDNPKVLTYHSSKGLEFERVFIPLCGYNKHPKRYNYREALFVAMTRATSSLIISYQKDDKSQYLYEIDRDTYVS